MPPAMVTTPMARSWTVWLLEITSGKLALQTQLDRVKRSELGRDTLQFVEILSQEEGERGGGGGGVEENSVRG